MSDLALNDAAPAALDIAHVGDIQGALGTIRQNDFRSRRGLRARLGTLLAILGPGLIVMIGDNDAGAFSTYAQAGQDYGLALLWTLPLLVPMLYLNQEMAVRLGAVTGVGHARLILERFGRFWGAFSVIDLFLLNALTIVTEFIGISLALSYLGISRALGIAVSAVLIIAAASTGSFRRFERFSLTLCALSALLVPVFVMAHPPLAKIGRALIRPELPHGANISSLMLLVIAIIGTTIAPWQLFFQQSYVIDKRITPRFLSYEKTDLWIGIAVVLVGAVAMMSFTAVAFTGTAAFGNFTDSAAVARGLEAYAGRGTGVMFALALLDASIIGASAVSLSTAYALADVLSLRHSLHRKATDARAFHAVYAGLIALAACLVLCGSDALLGLLTNAVQTLAGILLPSATVFLLLLCNDSAVLGPWVNERWRNLATGAVIWLLLMLSVILTVATIFPHLSGRAMLIMLGLGTLCLLGVAPFALRPSVSRIPVATRALWRMPPLEDLAPPLLTRATRLWMGALRLYLVLAMALVGVKLASMLGVAPGF